MAEEANDVTPIEVTAEAGTQEVAVEKTTEAISSEVEQTPEQKTSEVAEESTDQDSTTEAEKDGEGGEAEAEGTETDGDKPDETKDLKPKSKNRFQNLANENRDLKERLQKIEELQVPSEEDYKEDGQDDLTASVNAMKAEMEKSKAVDQIVRLNQNVDSQMAQVIQEFPQLNPAADKEIFKEDLARSLMRQYDKDTGAQYVESDGQKIMVSTSQLPYDYIKEKMDMIGMASQQAQVVAQKNVESMVSQAATPASSAAQPASKENMTADQLREGLANHSF